MRPIWPAEQAGPVDESGLERLYGYPDDRRWLAVNFVSSADGAAHVSGVSAGLSNDADQHVYKLGGDLADVLLVGAGTAVAEGMRGADPGELAAGRRARHGLAPVPPIAVVTGGSLAVDAPVITEARTPTIVLTDASAPPEKLDGWAEHGAEVIITGDMRADMAEAVHALEQRGLRRIHCDGGPHLFGEVLRAGVADELRLTLSPLLVSGAADRIAAGAEIDPAALRLDSALADGSTLMLRYLVER